MFVGGLAGYGGVPSQETGYECFGGSFEVTSKQLGLRRIHLLILSHCICSVKSRISDSDSQLPLLKLFALTKRLSKIVKLSCD
jgi:hypothetical protein